MFKALLAFALHMSTGTLDPWSAIVHVDSGRGSCSGAVIGPRLDDGRWYVLSAAHCLPDGATSMTVTTWDGFKSRATVLRYNRETDWAWLVIDRTDLPLFYATLAKEPPAVGATVWHGGYGIDKPGNLERGTYQGLSHISGQYHYLLSVSPGDSGGPIIREDTGEVLSPVYGTYRWGRTLYTTGAIPPPPPDVSKKEEPPKIPQPRPKK